MKFELVELEQNIEMSSDCFPDFFDDCNPTNDQDCMPNGYPDIDNK